MLLSCKIQPKSPLTGSSPGGSRGRFLQHRRHFDMFGEKNPANRWGNAPGGRVAWGLIALKSFLNASGVSISQATLLSRGLHLQVIPPAPPTAWKTNDIEGWTRYWNRRLT